MQPDEDLKAGDRILFLLKVRGPMTAKNLAGEMAVTAIAVRQHLQALEAKGLVTHNLMKGRVGRPAHVWKLTGAAEVHFPDNHRDLTTALLASVRHVFGEEGLQRVVKEWAERESKRFEAVSEAGCDEVTQRIELLVTMRREQGYMAEWSRAEDGSYRIVENHCPIAAAACECADICEGELQIFGSVLGDGVCIERSEHIVKGDRRCLYEVREKPVPEEGRAPS